MIERPRERERFDALEFGLFVSKEQSIHISSCSSSPMPPLPKPAVPNLYRTLRVVMSDGSTYTAPSAVRTPGNNLLLERDPANHPAFQSIRTRSQLLDRRESARLDKIRLRQRRKQFG